MRHFAHNIGDYAAATAHLSFIEDAAYHRLLRRYYQDEKPLPADVALVCRLVGARTRPERASVLRILSEFFILDASGYHQARADKEIATYKEKVDISRRNGTKGGRPGNPAKTQTDTPSVREKTLTTPHSPLPIKNKKEDADERARETPVDDLEFPPPLDRRPKPKATEIVPTKAIDDRDQQDLAFQAYQQIATSHAWPTVDFLTSSRRFKLGTVLRTHGLDGWQRGLREAADSPFLRNGDRGMKRWFSFDWLLDEDHFAKLLEGFYVERPADDPRPVQRVENPTSAGIAAAFARRSISS